VANQDEPAGEQRRGPLYGLIAAFFIPFLAVLFPYLVLDDYRRTRALVATGARRVNDPKRAPRQRDVLFWGAGVLWLVTLLAIPLFRSHGANNITAALLTVHLVSAVFSTVLLVAGWLRSDRRSPEEKQAQFAVREAQVAVFFEQRGVAREEAGVVISEPAVPWIGRGVWRRWFLVRWSEEMTDTTTLGLGPEEREAGAHATPVSRGEQSEAPVGRVVGDAAPPRAEAWTAAAKPDVGALNDLDEAVRCGTPSPFPFRSMSWPVCHDRLAVLLWEGNVGSPPDAIGLPMGVPAVVEKLVRESQGAEPWDLDHGWDGSAVFQCCDCGRFYARSYEV
jgi:hypothetical protein